MDKPPVLYDPDKVDQLEVTSFLHEVIQYSRERVTRRKGEVPLGGLSALTTIQKRPLPLASVLRQKRKPSLVLSIKQQRLNGESLIPLADYNPEKIARDFADTGVSALSVTTDPRYYSGQLHHLTLISKEVKVPVIRQDFIFDEYQVIEARAAGADGLSLIVSMLGQQRLRNLLSLTQRLRMTAVVMVHNQAELARVLELDPRVIGINNRDWNTLEVDLSRTHELRPGIPPHIVTLSMGGITTAQELAYVAETGVDAVQIGASVLAADNPHQAVQNMFALVENDPTDPWDDTLD